MGNPCNLPGDYQIEVSGWGLDDGFFAERTDLLWTSDGEKHMQLHRALAEGAIVFVRLVGPESSTGTVPVAYRVQTIVPMDCNGRCKMALVQMHPRSKESLVAQPASNQLEAPPDRCDTTEAGTPLQYEEVLR